MEFHVSLVGRKNLRVEIYRQLRRAIIDGRLGPGEAIPPSRELARRLSVSRSTVTVAYERLAAEGYISSRVGSGTFVSFHPEAVTAKLGKVKKIGVLQPRAIWEPIQLPAPLSPNTRFNFRTGIPDGSLFPHQVWRRLVARELRSISVRDGSYGRIAGHRGLREAISRHIAVSRGIEALAEDLLITNGTQQALDVVTRVLVAPGDQVAVEDPGYMPAVRLFRSLGARVIGVPVDGEGLVVDSLPGKVKLLYITPSHQYPLGVTMSMSRRKAVLEWAERTNTAIIEDDYDSEFRFGGRPAEPLHTLDTSGRVIYVGSFSKTMLPSLRIGFLLTPPSLRHAVRKAKYVTDWHTTMLLQAVLARFIDDGEFARHVRKVGSIYRARHELVMRILKRDFGGALEGIPSAAGMHITARCSAATVEEADAAVARALEQGVEVQRLSRFAIDAPPQAGIVLGYGGIATDDMEEGLRRLRTCFQA